MKHRYEREHHHYHQYRLSHLTAPPGGRVRLQVGRCANYQHTMSRRWQHHITVNTEEEGQVEEEKFSREVYTFPRFVTLLSRGCVCESGRVRECPCYSSR